MLGSDFVSLHELPRRVLRARHVLGFAALALRSLSVVVSGPRSPQEAGSLVGQGPPLSTPVSVPYALGRLWSHSDSVSFVGSCGAELFHSKMRNLKWKNIQINPQGIAFNPITIAEQVVNSLDGRVWTRKDLHQHGECFFSWNHHQCYNHLVREQDEMLEKMNSATLAFQRTLLSPRPCLFLTLGTAKVYVLKTTGQIVSNCHKQPHQLFTSKILGVEEVVESLSGAVSRLGPETRVIISVSPVRHTRDSLQVNSHSKAVLRVACAELEKRYKNVDYFPSFEVFVDELRDYRFYSDDLIHPNDVGQSVVFSRFAQSYFDPECLRICDEVSGINADLEHRPTVSLAKSLAYRSHLEKTLKKMRAMPNVDWAEEMKRIELLLANPQN